MLAGICTAMVLFCRFLCERFDGDGGNGIDEPGFVFGNNSNSYLSVFSCFILFVLFSFFSPLFYESRGGVGAEKITVVSLARKV